MQRLFIGLFLFAFIFQAFCFKAYPAYADGMVIPPYKYTVYESGQKAVIWFENDLETLILTTSVITNTTDFGWLIPTPNRPSVDKATYEIFTALDELTQPKNI